MRTPTWTQPSWTPNLMIKSIFVWNCQGAASKKFQSTLCSLLQGHKPTILILVEPRISGLKADKTIRKINYPHSYRVEAVGFSGGIWILWREGVHIEVLVSHKQFVHMEVVDNDDHKAFLLTAVYSSPSATLRERLWAGLLSLQVPIDKEWLLTGDFNATLSPDERRGGQRRVVQGCKSFISFMSDSHLLDLGAIGSKFTWKRGNLLVRLDRALCNQSWVTAHPNTTVMHLPRIHSDHRPLLITLDIDQQPRPSHFRFLAAWTGHSDFKRLVSSAWDNSLSLASNIQSFTVQAQIWNRDVYGAIGRNKRILQNRLSSVQRALERQPYSTYYLDQERDLLERYQDVCLHEEILWLQKSRSQWICDGDRNTHYYHTKAIVWRRHNKILMLKDETNQWVDDQTQLSNMAANYYRDLFSNPTSTGTPYPITGRFPLIPDDALTALARPVTKDETRSALFDMALLKSPGADGLQAFFFQSQWDIVGDSVFLEVQKAFEGRQLDPTFSKTLIALIPKVTHPHNLKDFRPISLCTTMYKLVTKIVAGRLKTVMPLLISQSQSSFIPGRNISDNIIIAQEAIHSMRRKTGKKGWMIIKVDLEKAFDKLRWDFIEETLNDARLPPLLIKVIMNCITTSSIQVLWNGSTTDSFLPQRGIRQGDPLSPYLFVLCMEKLAQSITQEVDKSAWKPISMGKNGPPLSHLFFADDLILFSETDSSQVHLIQRVLKHFCASSGQTVNKDKTRIFFSKNVRPQRTIDICNYLEFKRTEQLGKYLGVPILHGRVTRDTYRYLEERVSRKLMGWKANSFSLAGRITLAQSVLSTIPYYTMQTTRLLKANVERIETIIRNFVWGSNEQHRKIHLLKWDSLCQPKTHGGCGLRRMEDQNSAFLMKLAYGFVSDPDKLWVRVLRAKYGCTPSSYTPGRSSQPSYLWRSLGAVWDSLELGMTWTVGNGEDVKFWTDHWIGELGPLKLLAFKPLSEEEESRSVSYYVTDVGTWDWAKFASSLPADTLELISAHPAPRPAGNQGMVS